jgi:hypothetical protein
MTKSRGLLAALALLLAFGTVLAACGKKDSGGDSGRARTSSAPAKNEPTPREKYGAKAPDPSKLSGETLTIPEGMTIIPKGYLETLPKGKKFVNVIIPEGVTKIEEEAFSRNTVIRDSIETVVFPSTLTEIGPKAFALQSIKELYIPDNVTKIGERAFDENKITKLTLPETLKEIPESCFASNDLQAVVLPSGLIQMFAQAFAYNKKLNTVIWPDGPVNLVHYKDEVYDPNRVLYGEYFSGCGFTEATFPKGLKMIPEGMYSYNKIKNLAIPEGVELISADAFFDNPLETITLPSTLKVLSIGSLAPKNLKNPPIKTITIGDDVMIEGEAQLSDAAAAVLGHLIAGPAGLLAGFKGADGKTHLPGDFMSFYGPLFGRKAGTYEYSNGDWKLKQ